MNDGIMVIETSCEESSITVCRDEEILGSFTWNADRNQSSLIFIELRKALDLLGETPLKTILVGAGPGAYGSIRVALAVADGLALALGAQVASISSWEGIPTDKSDYWVISNARRGGWAFGHITQNCLLEPISVLPHEEAMAFLSKVKNDGASIYSVEDAEMLQSQGITDLECLRPQSSFIMKRWFKRSAEDRDVILNQEPGPLYVRPPHITPAKRPSWAVRA